MIPVLSALANGAIASAILAATVWFILGWVFKRRLNASTRYALWAATLAATLCLPIFYLRPSSSGAPASQRGPRTAVPIAVFGEPGPAVGRISVAEPQASDRAPVVSLGRRSRYLTEWLAAGWGVVSTFLLLRLLVSWVLLDRRRARADRREALSQAAAPWLSACLAQRPGVVLATSDEISMPIAVGPLRPSILLPANLFEELSSEDLGRIVMHEAAHLARWDDYGLLVQRVVEALFPWHPVVRWITRQMDLEREVACDDFVLEATGQARQYASCLTRMVELCAGAGNSLAGAAAANSPSQLALRVDRLLDQGRHTGTKLLKVRLLGMVGVVSVVACLAGRSPALVAFARQSPTAPRPATAAAMQAPAVRTNQSPAPVDQPLVLAGANETRTPAPEPAASPDAPQPQRPALPAIVPSQVFIPVEVTEPGGRFVTGLGVANFKLFEDGVEQPLSQLVSNDAPVSVGIVADLSGSMAAKLEAERQAISELVRNARPADEFFLLQFNQDVTLSVPFTSNAGAIQNSIDGARAIGGTALRDAVHTAVGEMAHAHNARKALVILSDGTDNSSGRSLNDMRADLASTDASVYSMNLTTGDPARPALATVLGQGVTIPGDSLDEARSAAAKIAAGFRNRYVLAYTSSNSSRAGEFRKVMIEMMAPQGLPPLRLHYQTGYYGPK